MKKRILALIVCLAMVFTTFGYMGIENAAVQTAEATTEVEAEASEETVSTDNEVELSIFDQLMAAEDTETMYALMLDFMETDPDGLMALSADEINALREHIVEIDPDGNDIDTTDLLDTLDYIENMYEDNEVEALGHLTGTWDINENKTLKENDTYTKNYRTLTGDTTWNFKGDYTVNLQQYIVIPKGCTLTINGNGHNAKVQATAALRSFMFIVKDGGRLIVNGIVIDGGAERTTALQNRILYIETQTADDALEFKATNCTFQNAYYENDTIFDLRTNADSEISYGKITNCKTGNSEGVLQLTADKDTDENTRHRKLLIDNVLITNCASNEDSGAGGVIRTNGDTYAYVTIRNSTFKNNYSGGWGVILWNAIGKCTVSNCIFEDNVSKKRGGAISSEGENIEITNCTFKNNQAGDFGGAICLFPYRLSAKDAASVEEIIEMKVSIGNGCIFENNKATKGGAIAILVTSSKSEKATDLVASIDLGDGYMCNNYTDATKETGTSEGEGGGAIYAGCTEKNKDEDATLNNKSKITLNINSGKFYSNYTNGNNGGAILVDDLRDGNQGVNLVTVNGGVIGGENTPNTAENGGAIAIEEGNFIMNGGVISHNTASQNGGAIYINGGDFVMQDGNIENNTASGNGGAAYIAGGDATIYHGTIDNNKAVKGGAVYMAESDATLIMESGTMNYNEASDDGGAIYANGGLIKIGLEDCKNEDENGLVSCTHHTVKGDDRHHPQINNNKAADTGGGIAIGNSGTVHFYCGTANDNEALYKGVGKNVFMNGGEIFLYTGADVGVPRDPDLVIIGGTLHNQCEPNPYLNLFYYENNTEERLQPYQGLAELDEYMNLPEGEYFWTADEGYTFFGWTPYGPQSAEGNNEVRTKDDYKPSGTPVQINDTAEIGEAQGTYDGTADNSMNLYALWAPIVNDITYVDGLTKTEMSDLDTNTYPATYSIDKTVAQDISIPEVEKPGYKIVGWYIYQDENQNANWSYSYEDEDGVRQRVSYEPQYVDDISGNQKGYDTLDYEKMKASGQYIPADDNGDITLHIDALTFGDITLIAEYEPQFTDLKITKSADVSLDENQTFLFRVIGKPYDDEVATIDMTVAVEGAGSTVIEELPVGTYSVTEIIDWSWRYDYTSAILKTNGSDYVIASDNGGSGVFGLTGIELVDPDKVYDVTFTNSRVYQYWLSGDAFSLNQFTKPLDKLPEKIQ